MGISTTSNRAVYTGDGSSAVFAFQYEFHAQSDLAVYTWNSSRITPISTKVLNADYTISGVADAQNRYTNGANIIFNSSPASTDYITIVRDTSPTNPFSLKFNQVLPNAELIKALDRLSMLEQRIADHTGTRSLRLRDAFPLTFNALLPAKLPAGAALIVGSSGQTIEVGVVAYNGTTAATYFGILPANNGGTGLDMSLLQGIVYSPGTNTTLDRVLNGGPGWVMTSNGSSAPTFQQLAASLINSGIISVAFGGTGTGTSYIQYGVVFASSALQMANTAAGGQDVPLVGNAAAAPSFQPLNLASGSSVLNALPLSKGGTAGSSAAQALINLWPAGMARGDVLVVGSGLVVNRLGVGTDNQVLSANSSAANVSGVAWAGISSVSQQLGAKTANYNMTSSDDFILVSSSAFTVILPDATTAVKKNYRITKTENTVLGVPNQINLVGSGAQGIGTFGNSVGIFTPNESWVLFPDGVQWQVQNHYSNCADFAAGSCVITSSGGGVVVGTTIFNQFTCSRSGQYNNWRWDFKANAGVAGTGDYRGALPALMPINTSLVFTCSSVFGAAYPPATGSSQLTVIGIGFWNAAAASFGNPTAYPVDSTKFGLSIVGISTWAAGNSGNLSAATLMSVSGRYPVAGWQP